MKKTALYSFLVCMIVFAVACGSKNHEEVANNDEWPEMDEFHMIMADSFHPYKDSAYLEPAKANAAELAKVAGKWASSPLPEKVDNDQTKANLTQLKSDADSFVQIVQTGDSVKIGEALTALHDQFHKIQEAWYGKGEGHEGGHDKH
ncbi:MAG: hypothetical protein U0U09_05210 [Cyclobacteriaceae bacterium]